MSKCTGHSDSKQDIQGSEIRALKARIEKLKRVVEAAKGLPQTEWALMEALAALEEDV
jgi:hypothetical protein